MSATCASSRHHWPGVAAREGLARDEQQRVAALRLQQPRPLEHVRPVARGRRRPRRRRRGAEELVHHDHRVGAARREDGEVEDALRLRGQPVGVGRLHRRADARAQVHVPVDRLRAGRARPASGSRRPSRRRRRPGGRSARDQLRRAVVDPERLRRRAARTGAAAGLRAAARRRRRRRLPGVVEPQSAGFEQRAVVLHARTNARAASRPPSGLSDREARVALRVLVERRVDLGNLGRLAGVVRARPRLRPRRAGRRT